MSRIPMLNQPQPIKVTTNPAGEPSAITMRGRTRPVARVLDQWRVDDEWWVEARGGQRVERMYYSLEMESGSSETVFHDLVANAWFWQRV